MKIHDNLIRYHELRRDFPFLIYENYHFAIENSQISLSFRFNLSDKFFFNPSIQIPVKDFFRDRVSRLPEIRNLVFHIGMVEMISYWKTTCSPVVIVKPHRLDDTMSAWWKKLFLHGLGEFFYTNGIDPDPETFLTLESEGTGLPDLLGSGSGEDMVIPVGGGKDSALTLDLLSRADGRKIPFVLNPQQSSLDVIRVAGFDDILQMNRTLDPLLLQMNGMGFLNGHTPFSALVGFTGLLAAILTGSRYVILSNESSANEPTVPGSRINHQYTKSFEFETDFRNYVQRYISNSVEYFSLLRPLSELQIAWLFSSRYRYLRIFRSCNRGSKTNTWCGACPKCLFTSLILSPFLTKDRMLAIFGKDLAEEESLLPLFRQLTGQETRKPFECVGTVDEVNVAVRETVRKLGTGKLPYLYDSFTKTDTEPSDPDMTFMNMLAEWNDNHYVPARFLKLLISEMNDRPVE